MAQLADSELVLAAQAGEMEAFEGLYRRHFERVYDFAIRTMRDRHQAADAVQDAFLKAHERITQLRDPGAFRPWLYAIVRRELLTEFRRARREAPTPTIARNDLGLDPLLTVLDDDALSNPMASVELADSAALVWEAAGSLDADTYTVLDLHVRQGLSSAEIAEVLGISKGNAYTRLNRMKERTGAAISTFLLIRKGTRDCDELSAIVASESLPPITSSLRRTVDRHVRNCDVCDEKRKALGAPMEIFAALAAVPPPNGLEAIVWDGVAGSLSGDSGAARSRPWKRLAVAAALTAVLGLASGVAAGLLSDDGSSDLASNAEGNDASAAIVGETTEVSEDAIGSNVTGTSSDGDGALEAAPSTASPATFTPTTASPATFAPTPTAAPTTTTSAAPPPDTTPPSIAQASSNPGQIWELDEDFLSCPANSARVSQITAVVSDGGSGVTTVDASWTIGSESTTLSMVLVDGVYAATFGPFSYLSVPDNTSPSILIVITASDAAANESKASANVVVNSLSKCFG